MKLTTWVTIDNDNPAIIEVPVPQGLPKGRHRATIEIDEAPEPPQELELPSTWNWTNWPADSTFSRKDLYDDTGR